MISNLCTIGVCAILLLFTGCTDDDDDNGVDNRPKLYSNYSLSVDEVLYTHSDEEAGYDFCTDVSTRSISTDKYYDISTVRYEVFFSPFNGINKPKVSSYGFYVFWDIAEPDLSLYDAVDDIIQGNSARKHHLQFVLTDEEEVTYSNSPFTPGSSTNIDNSANWQLDIVLPDNIECLIYGERVAELNYQYSGFVYSNERSDSLFIDHFDLQLFVPLSL